MGVAADMQAVFADVRDTIFADAKVTIRHNGREYSGLRAALQTGEDLGRRNALQTATGAVRISVADLKRPHPQEGDPIQIQEAIDTTWIERSVTAMRFDQVGATVLIEYGAKYA